MHELDCFFVFVIKERFHEVSISLAMRRAGLCASVLVLRLREYRLKNNLFHTKKQVLLFALVIMSSKIYTD